MSAKLLSRWCAQMTVQSRAVQQNTRRSLFVQCNSRGWDVLQDPRLNKGMGFSIRERQALGIHGLLPARVFTPEVQLDRVEANLDALSNDLLRYMALTALQDRNEKLFYRVLCRNVEKYMPIVYTPTVGLACQKFGLIYQKPKGIYVSIHDFTEERIYNILSAWPEKDIRAICVTDGERILGLGDLGAQGMGIPVGKLSLYVALAGVQPQWCLPISLDVGTNNEELLKDPFYIGCTHKRIRGDQYDEFIDNFMKAVVRRFGQTCLIQYEDFANQNAFKFLSKYQKQYCTFNDDIQGTASVAVAGLLAASKITQVPLEEHKILFYGAGEASIGIAQLTCMTMEKHGGLRHDEARKRIWMVDSKGLIVKGRANLTEHKMAFAQDHPEIEGLEAIVDKLKPTAIIGAATIGGAFTESILRKMASSTPRPIVFALSNPTHKAECTAEEAYRYSDGRAVYASGSPMGKVEHGGKTFHPGQGNNSYIFPGVGLGVICCQARHVPDEIFLLSAEVLASLVSAKDMDEGRVYPPLSSIREISIKIAAGVVDYCYKKGLAACYPEPENKEDFVRSFVYNHDYDNFYPDFYDVPQQSGCSS